MNSSVRNITNMYISAIKEIDRLNNIINKAIELLNKYNDKESNYYVPVNNCIDILKGADK